MTQLLIAQELFLLTHDDESGKNTSGSLDPNAAFAGALLLDLIERAAIEIDDKKKVTVAAEKAARPLLGSAQAVIRDDGKSRSVSHWVHRLPWHMKKLPDQVGDSLVDDGVLDKQRAKVLGIVSTTRWPERDPEPERQLRSGLQQVLLGKTTPTPHQQLLVPLLSALDIVPKLVDKADRSTARATAKEMTKAAKEGRLVSSSVSQAVQAAQTAVLVAVITPVIVSSSS